VQEKKVAGKIDGSGRLISDAGTLESPLKLLPIPFQFSRYAIIDLTRTFQSRLLTKSLHALILSNR